MKQEEIRQARRSIRILFIESALTRTAFVMPVVYLLWTGALGMNQWQIGLLQAAFAASMLLLQFPTGYFADRVSHKLSNSIGDLMLVTGMVVYVFSGNFWHAVLAEVILGIGYSFSGGADNALLKKHADTVGADYQKLNSRLISAGLVFAGVTSVLGGVLGAENIRLVFAIEAVVMVVALVLSLFITDTGVKHATQEKALRGMASVVKKLTREPLLLRRMLLGASLFSSTMILVWFLTPMFFAVDLSLRYHGLLFAAISVAAIAGSEFAATKRGRNWRLATPLLLIGIVYLILGAFLSIWTLLLFLLSSFARGVNSARVAPAIQEVAPESLQASAISLFNVFFRVFLIGSMLLVNWLGNIDLQLGLLSCAAIALVSWIVFRIWSE